MDTSPFKFIENNPFKLKISSDKNIFYLDRINENYITRDGTGRIWQADHKKSGQLADILTSLNFSSLKNFNINDEDSGINEPLYTISISGKEKEKQMIIGSKVNEQGENFIKFEKGGIAFAAGKEILSLFNIHFDDFSAKNPFDGNLTALNAIIFKFNETGRELCFNGDNTKWNLKNKYSFLFSEGKILNYLLKFIVQKVDDFKKMDLKGKPVLSVFFQYKDSSTPAEKVEIFKTENDMNSLYVKLNSYDTFGKASSGLLSDLNEDIYSFIDSKPFKAILKRTSEINILNNSNQISLIKSSLDKWSLKESPSFFKNDCRTNDLPA